MFVNSEDNENKTFDILPMQLRRIKHELTHIGASVLIENLPYFSKPCEKLVKRMANMGLSLTETDRLGRFIAKRVA